MVFQRRPCMCRNKHEQQNDKEMVHVLGKIEQAQLQVIIEP